MLSNNTKLMILNLETDGHYATYLQYIIRYRCTQSFDNQLDIVVTPKFITKHGDVVELAKSCGKSTINFVAITKEEEELVKPSDSLYKRTMNAWRLFCRYASILESDHCIVMWLDHMLQLPIALHLDAPCQLSGICFRPMFHYRDFETHKASIKDTLKEWRQKILYYGAVRHSRLKYLYCLDPNVVDSINQFRGNAQAVYLPDPVEANYTTLEQVTVLNNKLGVETGRIVLLFFGAIAQRKGIFQLLDALHSLSPDFCNQICLLLVGEVVESTNKDLVEKHCWQLMNDLPIQIIRHNEYVPHHEVAIFFASSDIVLAPYQRHVGSSGILLLAAAAQKPVLTSNYGLMGEITRHYGLGLAVDATKPTQIADGIKRMLQEPISSFYDPSKMSALVDESSPEKFAQVMLEHFVQS